MSLVISKVFTYDTDAGNYIQAVEAADEAASPGIGALEPATRQAINNFVVGCKQDGIWSAIKASCILAGARTRQGALVPLRNEYDFVNNLQPAPPQSFGFVDADYNRKTGLVGDAITKYLDSNRANNADPQNSNHNAVYVTAMGVNSFMGAEGSNATPTNWISNGNGVRNRSATLIPLTFSAGFVGASRSESSNYNIRNNKSTINSGTNNSGSPDSLNVYIFARNNASSFRGDHRLAFYSIGESLNLARLDSRVTDLIAAFNNPLVIP